MGYSVNRKDVRGLPEEGRTTYPMLDASHGCVAGFSSGISTYTTTEYTTPGVHQDQEGFVVLAGAGWARVGDEVIRLEPDVCFIAPAGVAHSIVRVGRNKVEIPRCMREDAEHVKVCWFHGAVE